jgi:sirohydrochlorin ferrochelatase
VERLCITLSFSAGHSLRSVLSLCFCACPSSHFFILFWALPFFRFVFLVGGGVYIDEIVCHPYFLSPGRHVLEDIPKLVADAIATLKIQIPIVTTDPLGSNTQLMIGIMHSMVQQARIELSVRSTSSKD